MNGQSVHLLNILLEDFMNKKIKKFISFFLVLCLMLMAACSKDTNKQVVEEPNNEETPVANGRYKPGTYEASSLGMHGDVKVAVTFDENAITDVKVLEHTEVFGIADTTIETLPKAIVSNQSVDIDALTGATMTTRAILTAVKDTVTQAGGSVDELMKAIAQSPVKDEVLTTDVVIAGAGAAGLSAAVEAASQGANVIVVEKQGMTGGSTVRSGGKLYAAGTELQKSQGIEDSAEAMANFYNLKAKDKADKEKVKIVSEKSADNFNWLSNIGVKWSYVEELHPTLTTWRVHNVEGGGGMTDGHGGQITVPLEKKARELGVQFMFETPATDLLTDSEDNVVGLKAIQKNGSIITINAKSTIIATGGFDHNKELMAKYSPQVTPVHSSVPDGNVGDGLLMGEAIGAKVYSTGAFNLLYIDFMTGASYDSGLWVNEKAERFVDEFNYCYTISDALFNCSSNSAYLIVGEKSITPSIQAGIERGLVPGAKTAEELAEILDIDASNLKKTVERYNELCSKGNDEDFGKPTEHMISIDGEMIYGIKMNPVATGTFTGLVTDTNGRVLKDDNTVISGLYAAGEVAYGDILYTEYPGCGFAVNTAVTFGRISGVEAAKHAADAQ